MNSNMANIPVPEYKALAGTFNPVNFNALGLFGFVEMMLFVGILLLGYAYLWRNGGLQWD